MEGRKIPPGYGEEPDKIHDQQEPKPERKVPEFIFLDHDSAEETSKIGATQQDPRQMFGSIQSMAQGKQPFYLRIFAFVCTILMLIYSFIVLLAFLMCAVLSLLLLRQSKNMNEQTSQAWKTFKKTMVFSLGFFVCIFNMSLGIGIVLMYFMLKGEKFTNRFLQEFAKRQR